MKESNQAILQALKSMGNSTNKGHTTDKRDTSSNHSENNNECSTSRVPQPQFLPHNEPSQEEEGIEQHRISTEDIARAHADLDPHIREVVSFRDFCEDKRREVPRKHKNKGLQHKVNKVSLPNFDGSGKLTAHAWLQKLNTYFTLSPMTEENALQFAILHLEGATHEWWHNGLVSLGHQSINSYGEFSQKLTNRFDEKDSEWYFQELVLLKQTGTVDEFISQFQELSVMIPDLPQKRLTHMFIEGLKDLTKNVVKPFEPQNLAEAIRKARRVESNQSKEKAKVYPSKPSYRRDGSRKNNLEKPCYLCMEP